MLVRLRLATKDTFPALSQMNDLGFYVGSLTQACVQKVKFEWCCQAAKLKRKILVAKSKQSKTCIVYIDRVPSFLLLTKNLFYSINANTAYKLRVTVIYHSPENFLKHAFLFKKLHITLLLLLFMWCK